jgi:hypothetical protein
MAIAHNNCVHYYLNVMKGEIEDSRGAIEIKEETQRARA